MHSTGVQRAPAPHSQRVQGSIIARSGAAHMHNSQGMQGSNTWPHHSKTVMRAAGQLVQEDAQPAHSQHTASTQRRRTQRTCTAPSAGAAQQRTGPAQDTAQPAHRGIIAHIEGSAHAQYSTQAQDKQVLRGNTASAQLYSTRISRRQMAAQARQPVQETAHLHSTASGCKTAAHSSIRAHSAAAHMFSITHRHSAGAAHMRTTASRCWSTMHRRI